MPPAPLRPDASPRAVRATLRQFGRLKIQDGEGHLAHLLDEAPVPVIVMTVEETASREHVSPRQVWRNVAKLAKSCPWP